MKRIIGEAGGRPRANDDLFALQELILTGSGAPLLAALPSCVVSGCAVTPGANGTYNVAAGVVWLSATAVGAQLAGIYDFPGAVGTTLPANFNLTQAVAIDQRPYQTGGTKTCITETRADLDPVDPDTPGVALYADGPVFWYEYLAARTRPLGLLEFGDFAATDFGPDGKGTGIHRGWAIPDGRNGTRDMRGRMPLFYNPDFAGMPQRPVGDTGGTETHTLTVAEIPSHNHNYPMWNHNTTGNSGYPETAGPANQTVEVGGSTYHAGGGQAHNNMPPFVVVLARQWVGL